MNPMGIHLEFSLVDIDLAGKVTSLNGAGLKTFEDFACEPLAPLRGVILGDASGGHLE
jgi:hypothetical protein